MAFIFRRSRPGVSRISIRSPRGQRGSRRAGHGSAGLARGRGAPEVSIAEIGGREFVGERAAAFGAVDGRGGVAVARANRDRAFAAIDREVHGGGVGLMLGAQQVLGGAAGYEHGGADHLRVTIRGDLLFREFGGTGGRCGDGDCGQQRDDD
jgi:hypothetical protein